MTAIAIRLGAAEYGLPIAEVREVLRPPSITRTPFAPADVCGIAQVRGMLLAVIDLGTRLGGPAAAPPGRLVLVRNNGTEVLGLLVDGIAGLVEADEDHLQPAPAEAEVALPPGWLAGVATVQGERKIALLNLDSVLARGAE